MKNISENKVRDKILKEFYSITFPLLIEHRLTLAEIGDIYSMTRQNVYRIIKDSRSKLPINKIKKHGK